MDLSIIIINYKSADLILDCLATVYRETTRHAFEVIIVDNFSQDNSQQIITEKYPDVSWLKMAYNSGFSRANNAGIRRANGKYILLLNSDTLILDGAIDKLIDEMEKDSTVVASSVQLLHADQTFQNAGNYFSKGGLNTVLTLPFLSGLAKSLATSAGMKRPSIVNANDEMEVDWISGAFMLVRRSVLTEHNLMDEDFFLFSEEIEWCSRLKKLGKIKVYPALKVIHLEGGTVKKTMDQQHASYFPMWESKGLQLMLSNLLRIRKQYNLFWMLLIFMLYVVEVPVFFFGSLFSTTFEVRMSAGYAKNVARLCLYLPKLIAKQPYFYKTIG